MNQNYCSNEIALRHGNWVKLICGASNEDLPSITDLCAIYAAAGVNCVDVAADLAVATAAKEGLEWAKSKLGNKPWLMLSISDGKDLHFRKAFFNPESCPPECSKPCIKVCPANAIEEDKGIIPDRCYGCGRCLPVCPLDLIQEKDNLLQIQDLGHLISKTNPDAIEIHTAPGRINEFEDAVKTIVQSNIDLKRIAVSCGLEGHGITAYDLSQELWSRHECLRRYKQKPLWQLDGRPMTGDLGRSSAKSAISLFKKIHALAPPGPLQLAGGTNAYTIDYLENQNGIAGIAFGGIARKLIQPFLTEAKAQNKKLIEWPEGWEKALKLAKELINPWLKNQYSTTH
ncbi:LdpA C-terminal domain-containing domain [Prochlorococcus marinus]|uniref:Light dependent period protein LdpA domain-containing protein n=1 Tax=Prochlorococcus marinus TaxID=1219 RepID=UPI0022B3610C|nr:LdpA C-terminal domain-containing domain [Prochlorococcus marinus]